MTRPISSPSNSVRKIVNKTVPIKRLNRKQVEDRPVGLVAESESEDEDDLPPRSKQVQSILSIVGSLNKRASEACSYIRGKISNRDIFALLLVDTGNTTPNDLISEEFFLAAELTWIPQDDAMRLGTADSSGGGLQVLGQVEQLKLHVEGMNKPIFLQPWVVRGLSHPVNLGMHFMQRNGVTLKTSQYSSRFIINGESTRTVGLKKGGMFPDQTMDKRFPRNSGQFHEVTKLVWKKKDRGRTKTTGAISTRKREESVGQIHRRQTNQLYVREPVTIPAGSMKFICTQATERVEGEVFVEDLVGRQTRDLEKELLVPRAVYSAINNVYFIAVSNFGSDKIKLRPGTCVASVYRTEDFNICAAAPAKPGGEKIPDSTARAEAATLNQSARGTVTADSRYVPRRSQRTSRATLNPKRERGENLKHQTRCKDRDSRAELGSSSAPRPGKTKLANHNAGATLSGTGLGSASTPRPEKTQPSNQNTTAKLSAKRQGYGERPGLPSTTAGERNGPPGPGRIQNLTDGTHWTKREKEKFIKENLPLDKMKLIQNRPDIQAQLVDMLVENFNCLSLHENDYGETDILEFEIKLKEGTIPKRQHPRPLNPVMQESVKEQIKTWTDQDVIEPANSPWASPLVPVKKKDGRVRWAVDYRFLNHSTIQDSYPLQRIRSNLEKLSGARVYSMLDASGAYHNIRIHPDSRSATTFTSPYGAYQFKRLPFGLVNAGASYSRMVQQMLSQLPEGFVLCYLDDVLVYSSDVDSHLAHLTQVIQLHRAGGIKLQLKKTHLFQEEINYLGHRVSGDGVGMIPEYVERVLDWPTPTSVKELNTFLGFSGYYRSYIPEYAKLTVRLNALKKQTKLEWNHTLETDFQELKSAFRAGRLQGFPRFDSDKPFTLTTDFSATAISGVLSQNQDGEEKFLGAWGRKCNGAEINYPSHKGELLAAIKAMEFYGHILRGKPFILVTDASALKKLESWKSTAPIFMRWYESLAGFNFTVEHKKGSENTNADALSRSRHLPSPTPEECDDVRENVEAEVIIKFAEPSGEVNQVAAAEISAAELQAAQEADSVIRRVRGWVLTGTAPSQSEVKRHHPELAKYRSVFSGDTFKIEKNILYFIPRLNQVVDPAHPARPCLPDALWEHAWQLSHCHPLSGHRGIQETTRKLTARFFTPDMAKRSQERAAACDGCLGKMRSIPARHKELHSNINSYVMEKTFIDLVTMCRSVAGNRYLLTVEDGFSRYVCCYPVPNKEAQTIAQKLAYEHFPRYGLTKQVHSDQGLEFVNQIWAGVCKLLQINHTLTPPYNPSLNIVERAHRTLGTIWRSQTDQDFLAHWDQLVQLSCFAYNSAVHSATGFAPYKISLDEIPSYL